jgi:hypothetical protein
VRPGPLNVASANRPHDTPLQKLLFSATLSKDPEILQQGSILQTSISLKTKQKNYHPQV